MKHAVLVTILVISLLGLAFGALAKENPYKIPLQSFPMPSNDELLVTCQLRGLTPVAVPDTKAGIRQLTDSERLRYATRLGVFSKRLSTLLSAAIRDKAAETDNDPRRTQADPIPLADRIQAIEDDVVDVGIMLERPTPAMIAAEVLIEEHQRENPHWPKCLGLDPCPEGEGEGEGEGAP